MIKEENAGVQIYNHAIVPIEEWKQYDLYLDHLLEKVQEIRKKFKIARKMLVIKEKEKFEGRPDLGIIVKELLMKTTSKETDKLPRLKKALQDSLQGRIFGIFDTSFCSFISSYVSSLAYKINISLNTNKFQL